MKLISIVIPVYKVEEYLDACLESVVNQTYKNLEIILVDDGSPDNCPIMCDEWAKKDDRIKVIHKENGGLSSARNSGIDIASGELICFIDSDDTINPQMIEILYKTLNQSMADISVCSWKKVQDINSPNNKNYDSENLNIQTFEGDDVFELLFNKKVPLIMSAWAKLYKKEMFNEIRYPIGMLHEDEAVIHKILYKCKKLSYVDYEMYNNTQRNNSITATSFSKKRLQALQIMNDRVEFIKEFKPKYLDDVIHHYIRILILYYHYSKWAKFEKDILTKIKNEIDKYSKKGYKSKLTTMFYKFPAILDLILKVREKFV